MRGEDLLASTAAQLHLAPFLPTNSFADATFYHHLLLTGPDGRKLSKSTGSPDLRSLRQHWESPAQLYRQFDARLGISAAGVKDANDLLAHFNPSCLDTR